MLNYTRHSVPSSEFDGYSIPLSTSSVYDKQKQGPVDVQFYSTFDSGRKWRLV